MSNIASVVWGVLITTFLVAGIIALSFIVYTGMSVYVRDQVTKDELVKFFSGCHAINKDTIQCHVPEEWDVIKERK